MNKRDAQRLQKQADLQRLLVELRARGAHLMAAAAALPAFVSAPADRTEDPRRAARVLAGRAARYAGELEQLPATLAEVWDAASTALAALGTAESKLASFDFDLVEAEDAMLFAQLQIDVARRLAVERSAIGAMHGCKGGRPAKADRDAGLRARFLQLNRTRRKVAARELYEDVAAEFGVAWWTVRDAVLAAKKTPKKATPGG